MKNLNELAKAQVSHPFPLKFPPVNIRLLADYHQLMFYASAAEALSTVQGEIEELSVAAEGEYRCVHSPLHFYDPLFTSLALVTQEVARSLKPSSSDMIPL